VVPLPVGEVPALREQSRVEGGQLRLVVAGRLPGRWCCALCGAELVIDRPLGMFCTGAGLLTRPTSLWACEPRCR